MNDKQLFHVYLRKASNAFLREQAVELIQKYARLDPQQARTHLNHRIFPLMKNVDNDLAQQLVHECAERGLFAIVRAAEA